ASGAVVSAGATVSWTNGQSLDAVLIAAGLTVTGPFTLNAAAAAASAIGALNGTVLAGGTIDNPTTALTGAVLSGATFPATLFPGASLTGDTSVFGSDLVIPAGYLKDSLGNINVSTITLPKATTTTLNSLTAAAGLSATGPYTLVQSLPVTANTVKLSTGTVTLQTVLASGEVSNPATNTGIVGLGPQSLVFDANGALLNEFSPQMTIPWAGANANQFNFDMGSAINLDAQGTAGGQGLDGVIQLAGAFATRQMTRNGFTSGFLDRLETDSTGVIFGVFTNGQRRPLYQVALANFPNSSALNHTGSNSQQETIASGTPVLEKPSNGGMGSISPFGLEQSNVDLAGEF
ncbi:MAG: flagellar hook-basal body complex protein, partial [Mariprofundales bacterium]